MTAHFTAVIEQGRLRPLSPVELPEGVQVDVYIVESKPVQSAQDAAAILAAIAALPSAPVDPSTSQRHDEVLYGREAHP